VGKSTLFNCLTNANAQAENFPFCTVEPNLGVITVPDERLDKLAELESPEKVTPTTVEILDIAGLVKGASKGEGLGNQFLGNIRETDAIIHILRCFDSDNVTHVDGSVNPVRDKEIIEAELILRDLDTVEKRMEKWHSAAKAGGKEPKVALEVLGSLKGHFEAGKMARSFTGDEKGTFTDELYLLTAKPIIYVCNVDEAAVKEGNQYVDAVKTAIADENTEPLIIGAGIEADIAQLDTAEEKQLFLDDLGLAEPGVNKLIRLAYDMLNLITFFTVGPKEVRAWTVRKGSTAPQAAGTIHSDFERGFIRAEVIKYQDFVELKTEHACREAGKIGVEGKEYIVKDGDLMHYRFNV